MRFRAQFTRSTRSNPDIFSSNKPVDQEGDPQIELSKRIVD